MGLFFTFYYSYFIEDHDQPLTLTNNEINS